MKQVELIAINQSGEPVRGLASLPDPAKENCAATASFYDVVGFVPPWIGYLSLCEGQVVGGGGFKGPPLDDKAEIAYYTLPEFEGRGFATATARELVKLARAADPKIVVTAQTLPVPNASNALLKKLGFTFEGVVHHSEDGEVWEWYLRPEIFD